jgi:hypothetical protein
MELVGVRNIEFIPTSNTDSYEFFIDSNIIFKVTSISGGIFDIANEGTIYPMSLKTVQFTVLLNGGHIFDNSNNASYKIEASPSKIIEFPIYLNSGNHYLQTSYLDTDYNYKIILYGLEFKLTTP